MYIYHDREGGNMSTGQESFTCLCEIRAHSCIVLWISGVIFLKATVCKFKFAKLNAFLIVCLCMIVLGLKGRELPKFHYCSITLQEKRTDDWLLKAAA